MAQCQNNLKQLSLAMLGFEQKTGHLPSGGWGCNWVGDPDRGTDIEQPGAWGFAILPHLEHRPARHPLPSMAVERPRGGGGAGRLPPLRGRDERRLSRRTLGPRRPLRTAPPAPRGGGWQIRDAIAT